MTCTSAVLADFSFGMIDMESQIVGGLWLYRYRVLVLSVDFGLAKR